jgi:hypothetical protein
MPPDGTSPPPQQLYTDPQNMPKRAAADARPGPEKASRGASGQTREKPPEDEMGEFEDAWEDEIEGDNDDAAQSDGVCLLLPDAIRMRNA